MQEGEQFIAQVDRLVASHGLRTSESLCKLLCFLARHALDHPSASLKEYEIATEVFGRSTDFDPQVDSIVRVQAGRLRLKLAEYYNSDGAEDTILVELPKGTYVLTFRHRLSTDIETESASNPDTARERTTSRQIFRGWTPRDIILSILLAASVGMIVGFLATRSRIGAASATEDQPSPAAFRLFWKGFVSGREDPLVVFSNAAFVGRSETGMRYYDATKDAGNVILDHYTGVGEVLAVHNLDQVFGLFYRQIRVKRGSLFTLDDLKNNNLIFIGSPSENLTLLDIPGTQEFVFKRLESGSRKGDLAIVNVHPQPDEPTAFVATSPGQPMTEDYAVIGLVRGIRSGQLVLILAGTSTIGTQAAAEYVCDQNSVEELLLRLSVSQHGSLKPFEAVLRVGVTRGVPIATEIVALRKGTL